MCGIGHQGNRKSPDDDSMNVSDSVDFSDEFSERLTMLQWRDEEGTVIACLSEGDVRGFYREWHQLGGAPTVIISDGAYGVGGFRGDPKRMLDLPRWYLPHVQEWSRYAGADTTLWFWGTEESWATVHPLLLEYRWKYEGLHVWNKGIGQVAGNVNSDTIRRFPVVTEVCGFYSRELYLPYEGSSLPVQEWLRAEWLRSGLPLVQANTACGVKNAAARKYLTADSMWYFPPGEMVVKLALYATENGRPDGGIPYFSVDRVKDVSVPEWDALRYRWNHQHGVTNVWDEPSLRGSERVKMEGVPLHANQKPLALMRRIVDAVTVPGDVVWEPFGGLCSATVAAVSSGRIGFAAEVDSVFYGNAVQRINGVLESSDEKTT